MIVLYLAEHRHATIAHICFAYRIYIYIYCPPKCVCCSILNCFIRRRKKYLKIFHVSAKHDNHVVKYCLRHISIYISNTYTHILKLSI